MKKFAGLVVILAVLILGSYYGMGLITERTLKKDINMVNKSGGLHIDILEYHRGWFTSNAKFNWQLHIPERVVKNQDGQSTTTPAQDYAIDMPLTIYHGPIIFADSGVQFGLGYAYTDLVLPPKYDESFSTTFATGSSKPKLDMSVLVNYFNKSRMRINVPQFKLLTKDTNGQFEWLGMTNDVTVSSNLNTIDGDLTIDGMNFLKDDVKGTIGKVTSDYDLHQTKEGLYLGDASLSFPSVVITQKDQKIFEMEHFDVKTSSYIDGGLFSSDFKTSLEKIIANGKTYGPALLKMSIKNLDAQILAQLNDQVNKMQQAPEQQRQQIMISMLPELPKLFSKGAEFQISEVSFVMPEGKIEGDLLVALPKGDVSNPFELIQKVSGQGKLKVPAPVLKEILLTSAKQQLSQPSIQQAMIDHMQSNDQASAANQPATTEAKDVAGTDAKPNPDNQAATTVAVDNQTTAVVVDNQVTTSPQPQPVSPPLTGPELDKKAAVVADQKLASLVQSGLFVTNGSDYVVEFKLAAGQLSVNGQPFNPAMMKF